MALLLDQGGPALVRDLEPLIDAAEPQAGGREALRKLLGYVRENRDRMWYRQRLAAGRVIGSGLIEGGCKTIGATFATAVALIWFVMRRPRR